MHNRDHLQTLLEKQKKYTCILACELDANSFEGVVGIRILYWRWQRRKCVTCNGAFVFVTLQKCNKKFMHTNPLTVMQMKKLICVFTLGRNILRQFFFLTNRLNIFKKLKKEVS